MLKGKREFEVGDIPEPKSVEGSVVIDVKKAGIWKSWDGWKREGLRKRNA